MPESNGVTLVTDNGRLHTADLAGAANLQTTNGSIEVEGHAGPITAATSNGEVTISGATASVTAAATNGAIRVALAPDSPGPVELETTNGMVELNVGPAFVGNLSLETTIGTITVDGSVKASRIASGSNQVELAFGPPEQLSTASTTTGLVHVSTNTGPDLARERRKRDSRAESHATIPMRPNNCLLTLATSHPCPPRHLSTGMAFVTFVVVPIVLVLAFIDGMRRKSSDRPSGGGGISSMVGGAMLEIDRLMARPSVEHTVEAEKPLLKREDDTGGE